MRAVRIGLRLLIIVVCIALCARSLCAQGEVRGQRPPVAPAAGSSDTGRYFALVIGIDKYPAPVPQLKTAAGDAKAIADLLHNQYGFTVTSLLDAQATRSNILDQLAKYEMQLTPDDNLLIYYAGHGFRIAEADKSFWLPVDATGTSSSNRISADDLTTEFATLKARHILVVSDSCYSGGLTRDIGSTPVISPDEAFLRKTLSMKSRNIMASGRDEPVADNGPDGHSVFAWAVLQALGDTQTSLFTASTLFYDRVQRAVAGNSEQIPVYEPIRNSGDIGGDFVFRRAAASVGDVGAGLAATAVGYDRAVALYQSKQYALAVPIYSESCASGDPRSCADLGSMYFRGTGVAPDNSQAFTLFRKACDGGDAQGCFNLGVVYEQGLGVPQDYSQSVASYRKSCDAGAAPACSNLGGMYFRGNGVAEDRIQAVFLYRKGCDAGEPLGCAGLGLSYALGSGVPKDPFEATFFLRKGCDGGNAFGCSQLGNAYEHGIGVVQDLKQAEALYRKGCDGGDSDGCMSSFRLHPTSPYTSPPL